MKKMAPKLKKKQRKIMKKLDMREQALETFASTKKQKETSGIGDEQDKNTKRSRSFGSETIFF